MGLLNIRTLDKLDSSKLSISLDEAKAQCFIAPEDTTQDDYLQTLILRAQDIVEGTPAVPYSFFKKQFEAILEQEKPRILIPKHPLVEVSKIEQRNGNDWDLIDADQYSVELGDELDFVVLKDYARGLKRVLKITFSAGYDSEDDIPLRLKQALAALVSHLFEYRGTTTTQALNDVAVIKSIFNNIKRISI